MKKLLVVAAAIFGFMFCTVSTAYADVNNFTINNFDGDYTLSANDPQGSLLIKERLDVTFTDNNHGILRAIPEVYGDNKVHVQVHKVTNAAGVDWGFTTYKENDNLVVKIGDPYKTVTGAQTYIIDYEVQNVITFYDDHDELYWDINGDQWQQTFEKVHATFHLPAGMISGNQRCFTGGYGMTTQDCTYNVSKIDGEAIEFSASRPLTSNETLTAAISLPTGTFQKATIVDVAQENSANILLFLLAPVTIGGLAFVWWFNKGRDLKGRGIAVPEYSAPNKLTPAEIGALTDYSVDAKDISATIIDLAVRGYIKINQSEQKKLIGSKKAYTFELTSSDTAGLKTHEISVLTGLFGTLNKGELVDIKDLQGKFYKTVESVRKSVSQTLTEQGYFDSNPRTAGKGMIAVGAVVVFIAFYALGTIFGVGLLIAGLLVLLFGKLMPRRSTLGVRTKDQIEGLKLYLKTAEADRLKMMQSPSAPYAAQAKAPAKTVELFEKLLPFAMLLGVEKEWAKEFEGIYKTPPDWYGGNWSTFNSSLFVSDLHTTVSAMGTNFSPPQSSGSSGFSSGGGFSGGGGGGGGGGGW